MAEAVFVGALVRIKGGRVRHTVKRVDGTQARTFCGRVLFGTSRDMRPPYQFEVQMEGIGLLERCPACEKNKNRTIEVSRG